jgi:hypothetical protein
MTNSDDLWRHQQGAAPHAQAHDPTTAGLPYGQDTNAASSGGSADAAPSPGGGGGGGIFVFAIVTLLFAGPIFGSLYPLAVGSAFATGLLVNVVLSIVAPGLGSDGRLPFALASAVVVFWIMSRRDHRLAATNPTYRRWRHLARLALIGIFLAVTSLHDYDHGFWPRSFDEVTVLLGDGRFYLLFGIGVAVGHFLLRKPNGLTAFWHSCLTVFKLRPSELASSEP